MEQIEYATFQRKTPTVVEYCEKWLLMQPTMYKLWYPPLKVDSEQEEICPCKAEHVKYH